AHRRSGAFRYHDEATFRRGEKGIDRAREAAAGAYGPDRSCGGSAVGGNLRGTVSRAYIDMRARHAGKTEGRRCERGIVSFQATVARMIMRLPSGLIQAMAGRRTEAEGGVLDPRIALMAKQAATRPSMTALPVNVARQGTQAAIGLTSGKRRAGVTTRDLKVPGGGGVELEARLYTPANATGAEPLLVYLHQ